MKKLNILTVTDRNSDLNLWIILYHSPGEQDLDFYVIKGKLLYFSYILNLSLLSKIIIIFLPSIKIAAKDILLITDNFKLPYKGKL